MVGSLVAKATFSRSDAGTVEPSDRMPTIGDGNRAAASRKVTESGSADSRVSTGARSTVTAAKPTAARLVADTSDDPPPSGWTRPSASISRTAECWTA
jgi:hypothetical protein